MKIYKTRKTRKRNPKDGWEYVIPLLATDPDQEFHTRISVSRSFDHIDLYLHARHADGQSVMVYLTPDEVRRLAAFLPENLKQPTDTHLVINPDGTLDEEPIVL